MRFLEFSNANIRNKNSPPADAQAMVQFLGWPESNGVALNAVGPIHVGYAWRY
jgi:hypothetical protein